MTSYDTMRQLYFSAYDMELYVRYESVAYFICKIKMPNTALLNDLTNNIINNKYGHGLPCVRPELVVATIRILKKPFTSIHSVHEISYISTICSTLLRRQFTRKIQ